MRTLIIPNSSLKLILILYTLSLLLINCQSKFIEQTFIPQQNIQDRMNLLDELELMLESLDANFIEKFGEFNSALKISQLRGKKQRGQYLYLLGKMHLYGILPTTAQWQTQSQYLLAYHYFKSAAQKFQNPDAYYYLAVMEYLKINPTIVLQHNMQQSEQFMQNQDSQILIEDLKTRHLHNIQHNLYLAALLGHQAASLSLGFMLKEGIATNKNCTSALSYYLYVMKQTVIDIFDFPSDINQTTNFQKQLYCHQAIQNPKRTHQQLQLQWKMIMTNNQYYDVRTLEQIGLKYYYGKEQYPTDYVRSFRIFGMIQYKSSIGREYYKIMCLKGIGTQRNFGKAKQMFLMDSETDQASYERYLILQYLDPNNNKRWDTLQLIQSIYDDYIAKKQEKQKNKEQKQQNLQQQFLKYQKYKEEQPIKTHIMKYFIGALLLSQEITGNKQQGIFMIHQAAQIGNTMALSHLALLFIDGSDLSFDCVRAANFMATQSLSHEYFQSKLKIAKNALQKGFHKFSLIKYTQLMMVGHQDAFINSYFILNQYNTFNYTSKSWSVQQAQQNKIYRKLLKNQYFVCISSMLMQQFNIDGQENLNLRNLNTMMILTPQIAKQYVEYAKLKIMTIGINLHDISILKYYKYLKNSDIFLLHNIAKNTATQRLHIRETQYLLGKYYQASPTNSSEYTKKIERSYKEYYRATRDQLLANILFIVNDSKLLEEYWGLILRHVAIYVGCIVVIIIFLNWKRYSKFIEIIVRAPQPNTAANSMKEHKQKQNSTQKLQEIRQQLQQQHQREEDFKRQSKNQIDKVIQEIKEGEEDGNRNGKLHFQ